MLKIIDNRVRIQKKKKYFEEKRRNVAANKIMKLENKVDIKVFILYLLKNVDVPLEFTTINDMVLQDEFVGYFDFAFCFSELLDAGQIEEVSEDTETLYTISESGKETLESYESSLLGIIKERALKSALRLLAFNKNGRRILSSITEEPTGGYNLCCEVVDKEKKLFSIEVHLSERSYAEKLRANFEERAEIIFRGGLALLSGDMNFIFDE